MKKDNIKLSIFWVFSLLVIIFMMTFTAHAEETYFPMTQNENDTIPQAHIDTFNTYLDVENNYYFIYKGVQFSDGVGYYYVYMPKSYENAGIFGELNNNGYQFSLYLIGSANLVNGRLDIADGGGIYNTVFYQPPFTNFTNLNSSKYDSNISYVSNFKVFTNNTENADVVLKYGADPNPPLDIGVAIIPPGPFVPDYPSGTTPPTQVPPTYTPSDYTWTTPPNFDGSSVEAALGSIQNVIGWLANNLKEEFKNLIDNLEGFFKYNGDTIQYYGNAIIETLNNFIQNFYDNMAALVQPIFEKIAYITTPLEVSVIWDNISTTSLVTNVNIIKTSLTSFQGAFTGVSEPSEYKIPIHLENLPSSWFGIQTTQYIDLGIINGTVKDGLRLFVWAMVTYGLVVTIFDSIANYINGGGDES